LCLNSDRLRIERCGLLWGFGGFSCSRLAKISPVRPVGSRFTQPALLRIVRP
jgi:hypothetical protein